MRKSHVMAVIVILPILVIFMALATGGGQKVPLTQKANEYVSKGYLDNSTNQLIWNLASGYLIGTQYENHLTINASPKLDAVNIYILSKDPKKYFGNINCNCAYLGDNIIVCDPKLFDSLLGLIAIPPDAFGEYSTPSFTKFINSRFSFFIRQWILGHEIGHLVLGHGTGVSQEFEQQADAFAIEKMDSTQFYDRFYMWLGLSNVIGAMYSQTAIDQATAYPEAQLTTLKLASNSDGHPPWLIRLLDMTQLLLATFPDVEDGSGYFDEVRNKIEVVPDGIPTSSLCTAISPEIQPTPVPPQADDHDSYPIHLNQGYQFWRMTENDWAIAELTGGIDLMIASIEEDNLLPPELFSALHTRGSIYFIQGDYERAIADYQYASWVEPNDPGPYSDAAFAFFELGQLDKALEFWSEVTRVNPTYYEAWAGMGIALYAQGKTDEAIDAYKKALEMQPDYSSLVILRYQYFWTEKALQSAEALLKQINP